MLVPVASLVLGAALLATAGAKAADPSGARLAVAGYGVPERSAGAVVAVFVTVESLLGAAVAAGLPYAAAAAAALMTVFVCAQLAMIASGRGGAPCGCLGARGRIGAASIARTLLAGAAFAALAMAGAEAIGPAGAAAALPLAAVAFVLLLPRRPDGALSIDGEGPPVGARSVLADHLPRAAGAPRLVLFTSERCRLCRRVRPALRELERPGLLVVELDEEDDAQAWLDAAVPGSPFAVLLDADGIVLAQGTVNTPRQLASLLKEQGQAPFSHEAVSGRSGEPASRRTLLARTAMLLAAGGILRPGEAEAYHFCGHIYTTDGCPHPTGLPRIDSRGYPLRARDGAPVDDLGRVIDGDGRPVDDDGAFLTDPDGRVLPVAPRTPVCAATGYRFGITVRVDGAWYRCCGGHVRKLVDCCTTGRTRINGDRALRGYCFKRRRVFCVMYYQSRVPC